MKHLGGVEHLGKRWAATCEYMARFHLLVGEPRLAVLLDLTRLRVEEDWPNCCLLEALILKSTDRSVASSGILFDLLATRSDFYKRMFDWPPSAGFLAFQCGLDLDKGTHVDYYLGSSASHFADTEEELHADLRNRWTGRSPGQASPAADGESSLSEDIIANFPRRRSLLIRRRWWSWQYQAWVKRTLCVTSSGMNRKTGSESWRSKSSVSNDFLELAPLCSQTIYTVTSGLPEE